MKSGSFIYREFPWQQGDDVKRYTVIIPRNLDRTALFNFLEVSLRFPYFGHNWNALDDCLTDLEWIEPVTLCHEDIPLVNEPSECKIYLTVLADSVEVWKSRPVNKLIVIFPNDSRGRVEHCINEIQ